MNKVEQDEKNKKKIENHKFARNLLLPLVGLTMKQMTTKQQEDFAMARDIVLGLLDKDGKVNPI